MQFAYLVCAYLADILLDVLIIRALLRNGFRRFPFVLAYVVADLLTSVIELQPGFAFLTIPGEDIKHLYAFVYFWNERLIQVLVFLIVISLAYHATATLRARRTVLIVLVAATIVFAGTTFLIHFRTGMKTGLWMTPWTRDLNFGAAILNLGLWATLISSREKDYRILMVAGGLGIQFTGGAIGQAFRDLSQNWQLVVGDLMYLTNLGCLYIWWQAFRYSRPPARRADVSPK